MRLLKNATIYLTASIMQRGLAFFLAPLYTRFLTPTDYGVTGVVGSLVPIWSLLFGLGVQSSVTRLYYKYKADDPVRVARVWGTSLMIALASIAVLGLLLFASYALWAPRVLGAI